MWWVAVSHTLFTAPSWVAPHACLSWLGALFSHSVAAIRGCKTHFSPWTVSGNCICHFQVEEYKGQCEPLFSFCHKTSDAVGRGYSIRVASQREEGWGQNGRWPGWGRHVQERKWSFNASPSLGSVVCRRWFNCVVLAAFPCLIPKRSLSLWRTGGVPIGICELTLTPPAPAVLLPTYRPLVKCLLSCTEVRLGHFRPAFSVLKPRLCQRESEISEVLYVYFRWSTDTAENSVRSHHEKVIPF